MLARARRGCACAAWLLALAATAGTARAGSIADVTAQAAGGDDSRRPGSDGSSHGAASRALLQQQGERLLPWQQPKTWTPKYAELANDLPALIDSQRKLGISWMTMFSVTKLAPHSAEALLLMNALVSYRLIGDADSYIIMCASASALSTCMQLRLPCYNATAAVAPEQLNDYHLGTWVKVAMARFVLAVLPSDLSLHVSDHDVVYLKKIIPSVDKFFAEKTYNFAEATFAVEDFGWDEKGKYVSYIVNTGVIFMRNSANVRAMYDSWVALTSKEIHDQMGFAQLFGRSWVSCSGPHACHVARDTSHSAAVARHNTAWRDNMICARCRDREKYTDCWYDDQRNHCAVRQRLYIHFICHDKVKIASALGLWFLDRTDPGATNHTAIQEAGLPCSSADDVAKLQHVP